MIIVKYEIVFHYVVMLCWQITSLCLDGQHIRTLLGVENLPNLQWASFNDNDIMRIEVCNF